MDYSDVLLTVDFDHTLTGPDGIIPERNLEAIHYFTANGGTFTVNTGRSLPAAVGILEAMPYNAPVLLYNGAAAYDTATGQLSQVCPIDVEPGIFVRDLMARFPKMQIEMQGTDAHYSMKHNPGWEHYLGGVGANSRYAEPEKVPGPFLKCTMYSGDMCGCDLAAMYQASEEEIAEMRRIIDEIQAHWGHKVEVSFPCARIIDIQARGVSKIRAARQLQKTLGKGLLVCAGDAENDLPMLEGADAAYCPADGVVADRFENVCPCADGAVADVIYEKIPGLLQNKP